MWKKGVEHVQEAEQEKEEAEKKKEEKGDKESGKEQEKDDSDSAELEGEEDMSEIKFDNPHLLRTTGYKYALRQRATKKFLNTIDAALEWTPSPSSSP